jgi:hypothetical protein
MCLLAGEPKGEPNFNPTARPCSHTQRQPDPPTRAFTRLTRRHRPYAVKGSDLRKNATDQAISGVAFEHVKGSLTRRAYGQ